jgi:hypothetical protein
MRIDYCCMPNNADINDIDDDLDDRPARVYPDENSLNLLQIEQSIWKTCDEGCEVVRTITGRQERHLRDSC